MVEYGSGTTAFDLVFPDLVMGENTVLCPFHSESTPSMQINTMQKIFHCFGCGAHGTENDFISRYYGIGRSQTSSFKQVLFKSDNIHDYERFARAGGEYKANYTYLELKKLGVSDSVLEDLKVGSEVFSVMDDDTGELSIAPSKKSTRLVFPIIMHDRVLDLRTYTADKLVNPKSMSKAGAPAGLAPAGAPAGLAPAGAPAGLAPAGF